MLRLTELNVRMLEHDRRVEAANRHGWLRSSAPSTGRKLTLGAVLGAFGARLAPRTSVRHGANPSARLRLDAAATDSGAQRLA